MGKISAFNFITLNGYYEGPQRDIRWHRHGEEENAYAAEGLSAGGALLFGRVTYDLMASYWPTPMAIANDPTVAAGMNSTEKFVFSRTLKKAGWSNTRILKDDIGEEARRLKEIPGKDVTILGSGSIVTQLAQLGLIDAFQIMVDPVVLGDGTPMFKNLKGKLDLKLTESKTFKSGVVLLSYVPLNRG